MKNRIFTITCTLTFVMLLSSCGPSDMIWPSDRIGQMWVNRCGHVSETPGVQATECTIPWVDELFIRYGIRAFDKSQRDVLSEARTWELYIDGYAVDLPAFSVADFDTEQEGKTYQIRLWRVRLRKIPKDCIPSIM